MIYTILRLSYDQYNVEMLEPEEWDQVEDMEVVDTLREERLEKVRRRQLEWAANKISKDKVNELIEEAVRESEKEYADK